MDEEALLPLEALEELPDELEPELALDELLDEDPPDPPLQAARWNTPSISNNRPIRAFSMISPLLNFYRAVASFNNRINSHDKRALSSPASMG